MWSFILWTSLISLFYIFIGYPVLVALLARFRPRPVRRGIPAMTVSAVISAYNEEGRIGDKLRNLLNTDANELLCEIIVASDGSTDRTAELVDSMANPKVKVIAFETRRGKPAVLNDIIPTCRGEIVLLMDARQQLEEGSIEALMENFVDDEVGVVSGELMFTREEGDSLAAEGMGSYWTYEKFIRKAEAEFASVPGATGALYAIRKDLFKPIPAETLLDDVAIPMQAVVKGSRCIFDERAVVYDRPSTSSRQESIRKRRTAAGNWQLTRLYPVWLLPWRNPIWLQFVSHKILRLLAPGFLMLAFAANLVLSHDSFYGCLLALQIVFYVLAAVGSLLQSLGVRARFLSVPYMFVQLNATTALAFLDAVTGRHGAAWTKAYDGSRSETT
ncbi:MAG: glycosyltransferase family 2 protein [Verrucomicrobia bacterium]|nr:glycosyltransferase family 2 protein [Verrucomicrobiota bacterium]